MTRRALLSAFLMPVICSAQKFGTRADVVSGPSAATTPSIWPFFQMLLAMAIVLGLVKFVLPKLMDWLGKRSVKASGGIAVEETLAVPGGTLMVVAARGKTLLICSTGSSMSTLADLGSAEPGQPLFMDMLAQEKARPANPTFALANEQDPDPERIAEALERLERLTA